MKRKRDDGADGDQAPKDAQQDATHKQLRKLLSAITDGLLRVGQGASEFQSLVANPREFILSKLAAQREGAAQTSCFSYLIQHAIDSGPERILACIEELETTFGMCRITPTHAQLKLPCASAQVTKSDQKNGKRIGLVQIQSYVLAELLRTSDDLLVLLQEATLPGSPRIGCHLCKQKCLTVGHVRMGDHVRNKANDFCPSYWVVKDELVNFCSCHPLDKCYAPGNYFNPDNFKSSLHALINVISK